MLAHSRPGIWPGLRGFCLLILEKHPVGILAKESALILYPALFCFNLSGIYELYGLSLPTQSRQLLLLG